MSTTLAQLKTRLNYRINSDDSENFVLDAERSDYLDEAHKFVCNYYRWPFLEREDTSTTIVTGTQGYSLPSDMHDDKIISVRFSSTTHQITDQLLGQEPLDVYEYRVQNLTLTNGVPYCYHLATNSSGVRQIVLDVPPDFTQANALKIRYYITATTLDDALDVVLCPDEMTHLIIIYALAKSKEKEEEMNVAQTLMDQFHFNLSRVKQEYMKGASLVPRTMATPIKNIYPRIY